MPKELKLYQALGVASDANFSDIKKQYFILSQKYNPNQAKNKEKFQEIQSAYEILKDEQKRQNYDRYGEEGMKEAQKMFDDKSQISPYEKYIQGIPEGQKAECSAM